MKRFLIGDDWRQGTGDPFPSVNPADGSVIAEVGQAGAADIDDAVAAAKSALAAPDWRDLKPHERAALLHRMAAAIDARAEDLARIQMADNGKTLAECRGQARGAAACFRYYAAACETMESEVTPPRGNYMTMTVYEPAGVVAAITPWNSPLTLEAQKLAPALAAGNAVILKPSEVTPLIGLEYAKLALEAGLPPGVLNVVSGDGAATGRALVDHPGVDMVSFTGGTTAGRAIAEAAGRRLVPVALELGGKSPNIVFDDADFDLAVAGAVYGIFSGGGQSCIAGSRIFVQRAVFDDVAARLTAAADALRLGPPAAADTEIGPLVGFAHRDRVAGFVEQGRDDGADILCGGAPPAGAEFDAGAYYRPTVLAGIDNTAWVAREEIFGPVACLLPFDDEDDLVTQANDSVYGLAAGIWTGDYRRAWRVARRLQAGTVWINTYKQLSITTPFGGFKDSGIGREKGLQGLRVYTQPKALYWGLDDKPAAG